jgi:hypothetical protein
MGIHVLKAASAYWNNVQEIGLETVKAELDRQGMYSWRSGFIREGASNG